jgi:hypothetical protein
MTLQATSCANLVSSDALYCQGAHAPHTCRRVSAASTCALMAAVSPRTASVASLDARLVACCQEPAQLDVAMSTAVLVYGTNGVARRVSSLLRLWHAGLSGVRDAVPRPMLRRTGKLSMHRWSDGHGGRAGGRRVSEAARWLLPRALVASGMGNGPTL